MKNENVKLALISTTLFINAFVSVFCLIGHLIGFDFQYFFLYLFFVSPLISTISAIIGLWKSRLKREETELNKLFVKKRIISVLHIAHAVVIIGIIVGLFIHFITSGGLNWKYEMG